MKTTEKEYEEIVRTITYKGYIIKVITGIEFNDGETFGGYCYINNTEEFSAPKAKSFSDVRDIIDYKLNSKN